VRPVVSASARAANRLLAALPAEDYERLAIDLRETSCEMGASLNQFGRNIEYAYFPVSCVTALLYRLASGSTVVRVVVGNDGMADVAAFLGGEALPGSTEVLIGGQALRIGAEHLRDHFRQGGALQRLLLSYAQGLLLEASQTAVCYSSHSVDERLARCLLLIQDRSRFRELSLTQETMATMLGVRRESVSHCASRLRDAGCLRYSRGRVEILDRARLEGCVCECYRVIRESYERLIEAGPRAHTSLTIA